LYIYPGDSMPGQRGEDMSEYIEQIEKEEISDEPLLKELENKIKVVSKIVLFIAIAGFSTYAVLELFFGIREVFFAGLLTSTSLLIPALLVFLNRVKTGMIVFIIIMTCGMISTQFFYLHNQEFLGLMMIDFSVYFGLVITSGFILNEKRYVFIIVIVSGVLNGLTTAFLATSISLKTKRFFLIELFIFTAVGFLIYYFTYLYNSFIKKARLAIVKQKVATDKIIEVNKIFSRFVPNNFIRLLNKKDITKVRVGDQIQMNMTIMFGDIRSFTSITEEMTPKESFEFLNRLLMFIGPTIRHFHGIIDKYIGDAVLSLFPGEVDHAVMAAMEIQKLLTLYNQEQEKKRKQKISMGFGINSGDVIAGIIGEEERMEETVISDTVNLASRLESLTKRYGAGILISGNALKMIKKNEFFHYRFVDQIQAEGKILPVSVFEILDCENKEQKKRFELKEKYKEGWDFYCDGRIEAAIEQFHHILTINPEDKAAAYQVNRCRDFING
jgi:class 3 adenylate cyclase